MFSALFRTLNGTAYNSIKIPQVCIKRSKCKTMKAIVYDGTDSTVHYCKEYPVPEISSDNDVLVKIEYAGVCGTDVHIIQGEFPARKSPPLIMGHEFSGVIDSVGKKSIFKAGQRVAIYPCSACMLCDFCRTGNYHHCETAGLNNYIGIFRDGGWAEYCLVPQQQIYVLPDEVTTKQAGLTEPYSCIVHTFNRSAPIRIGSKILILGAGIIGNLFATGLHHHGHRDVTVSEMNKSRLELVKKLDTGFRLTSPDVLEKEKVLYDVIVDCTGIGKVMEISFNYLRQGGKYVVFGCCPPTHETKINPYQIFDKELTILGAKINPFTFLTAIAWIKAMGDRYVDYDKLGVKTYQLSDYKKALEDLKAGAVAKAVFQLVEK